MTEPTETLPDLRARANDLLQTAAGDDEQARDALTGGKSTDLMEETELWRLIEDIEAM